MGEIRNVICTGTRKNRNGEIITCKRIIAQIDHANDVRLQIKCGSCGTMNIIEAVPKQKSEKQILDNSSKDILHGLGLFPIEKMSI
jgi:hypothetical protein